MDHFDSIFGFVQHFAREAPHAPAFFTAEREEMSYAALARALEHGRGALADLGVTKGACVALVMESGPEMAVMLPLLLDTACCAPLNPAYTEDEFARYLNDLPADALLVSVEGNQAAEAAAARLGIPVIRPERRLGDGDRKFAFTALNKPLLPSPGLSPADSPEGYPSLLLYTSGTTARPKLVPHSLNSIISSAVAIAASMSLRPSDRCLCLSPLFHVKGAIGAWLASLASGASLIFLDHFDPQTALRLLTRLKATWYTAAPPIHQVVLSELKETGGFTHSLRFIRSCSAQMPVSLLADMEAAFGVPCLEAYGLTEACSNLTSNPLPPGVRKPGSAGLPISCEIRIMAPNGDALPFGSIGEVCISGDRVMQGYKNNPETNRTSYFGKWFRTGDQGRLDEDGYLFITGRLKELINKGGEKIAPEAIEEELLRHPDVAQAAVYAMPHPTLGEDVAACVTPRKGALLQPSELRRFVAERLAAFKVPSQIVVVNEIPKGPTGKVSRIGLHEKIKKLPEIAVQKGQTEMGTGMEAEILAVWRVVMDKGALSPLDDFFALGGDSIRALRIAAQISEKYDLACAVSDVLLYPSVRELAAELAAREAGSES